MVDGWSWGFHILSYTDGACQERTKGTGQCFCIVGCGQVPQDGAVCQLAAEHMDSDLREESLSMRSRVDNTCACRLSSIGSDRDCWQAR